MFTQQSSRLVRLYAGTQAEWQSLVIH
jgi:hypothetical protein